MRLPLLLYPNKTLTQTSLHVDPERAKSEEFKAFVKDLQETLVWYRGIGLSAIQTGRPDRVFVMRMARGGFHTFVNPQIVNVDDETVPMDEGCLSLPGVLEKVERYPWVAITALDIDSGETRTFDMVGIEAQCAQHEIEHLDGKMFSDPYGPVKRDIVKRKIKKAVRLDPRFKEPQ